MFHVKRFFLGTTTQPVRPRHDAPSIPGAWVFTLRSVPHHYPGIKAAIESTGDANIYFSEELAYIKGRAVSLFRIEATGFAWLNALYEWWRQAERDEAAGFDVKLYVHNSRFVVSLRERTAGEVEELIKQNAPRNGAQATPAR